MNDRNSSLNETGGIGSHSGFHTIDPNNNWCRCNCNGVDGKGFNIGIYKIFKA